MEPSSVTLVAIIALIVVVLAFLCDRRQAENAWTSERRELLNRIQHPEMMPTGVPATFEIPELEPDEIAKVGSIKYEDEVS